MTSTYFAVSVSRGQLSTDEIPFIGEEKKSAALRCDMNAGAVFGRGDSIRAPKLFAGGGFETNEFTRGTGAEKVVALP